ncbi:voltage-gated chloride channel family protein [Aureibacter tunicatorum]|uniref:H+/Cl- antiporter ClcA n=1 Tax=Aureibacter tunicatorum TaxID=866807 RepID=A0AAE3XPX0_9BACT|nr:voltage-gated chloride channel family protein [Aureibacter tunicatorum]MDR6240528.1 H+/Cl- antiporter ClcA [Aureibacter tunicatorum]BDD06611.1 chloride/fluoride channel protein [Aureibacter tunicatorum]
MQKYISKFQNQYLLLQYLVKWLIISAIIAICSGIASSIFLYSLQWATNTRENYQFLLYLLPLGGMLIGVLYHKFGSGVEKGNNLILDEIHQPKKIIPFKMAPMVLLGTIATHLFGGSAGREGTALQMSASIADQFTKLFKLKNRDRKIILISGMAAGFGSVFGTPFAGAVFGLEVYYMGSIRYKALIPAIMSSMLANYVTHFIGPEHTHYHIDIFPDMSLKTFFLISLLGIIAGLTARLFAKSTHWWSKLFRKHIKYSPLRPFAGGVIIIILTLLLGTRTFLGLGVPTIVDSFSLQLNSYDFLLKLLFTAITLGAGFKGGEVTPLFFIGAALGNALSLFIPLPMAFLAGLGFVAVFSGAANTPLACAIMAIELFGIEIGIYAALVCSISYLFSGHEGIYGSQIIGDAKHQLWLKDQDKPLSDSSK